MREIQVAAGLLWRAGAVLIMRCANGAAGAGLWEFPGGKIEPGEAPEAALVRELAEELGVAVQQASLWRRLTHLYAPGDIPNLAGVLRVHLFFFQVRAFAGEPAPLEGHEIRWVVPCEARALPFLPADRPVIEALVENDGA